jgi:hypothetical protein
MEDQESKRAVHIRVAYVVVAESVEHLVDLAIGQLLRETGLGEVRLLLVEADVLQQEEAVLGGLDLFQSVRVQPLGQEVQSLAREVLRGRSGKEKERKRDEKGKS